MKTRRQEDKKTSRWVKWLAAAIVFTLHATLFTSCGEKDELMEEPSWLGSSIYNWLNEQGNYSYTMQLIDDLGQKQVLSQTGSKTLFVATDDVYEQFFRQNDWGVSSYADLTLAQKKLLFNSSMVNNAYLVELLSSVSGPKPLKGQCMRRPTAASVFDSVATMAPAQMPNTEYWAKLREEGKPIVILRDNTTKPMIHFLPVFMQANKITDEDLAILTNGVSTSAKDAWVNGKKLTDIDITCKNGYIHKVDGLPMAADNMAEIVHSHANMSRFASLLDRFAAPYYDEGATKEYRALNNSQERVYTLKYFSQTSNTNDYPGSEGGTLDKDPDGKAVDATLAFDPGWNQYMYTNTAGRDLHYDCGALLVPTDDAFDYWWNHDGKALQDMYGTWEAVPMKVLVKMLDIDFIRSFTETVPSKFKNIVDNTNKVPIGITTAHVDSCFMGCNGVVYLVNRVFTPSAYSSVSFPALVNEKTMNVIYWAIEKLEFEPYLNSMDSYYSFIIPDNDAMLTYVDPCTYGGTTSVLYEFYWDELKSTVGAHRYLYDLATGTKLDSDLADASEDQVKNRLTDLLDNIIIVDSLKPSQKYYHTKGGSTLRIDNVDQEGAMTVRAGLQIEKGADVTVSHVYDMTRTGNGKSYVVSQLPLSSRKSLYSLLKDQPDTLFYSLYAKGDSANTLTKSMLGRTRGCLDYNCSLFDRYDYTVYMPADAEIKALIDDGLLPTWDDFYQVKSELEAMEGFNAPNAKGRSTRFKVLDIISSRIMNFIKYHIQDNAVYIAGQPVSNMKYETSALNPKNKRFYSVEVTANETQLSITDQLGNVRHVITTADDTYNIMGREYWIDNLDAEGHNENIYNASDVVLHRIDGPLFFEDLSLKGKWRDEVNAMIEELKNKQ